MAKNIIAIIVSSVLALVLMGIVMFFFFLTAWLNESLAARSAIFVFGLFATIIIGYWVSWRISRNRMVVAIVIGITIILYVVPLIRSVVH